MEFPWDSKRETGIPTPDEHLYYNQSQPTLNPKSRPNAINPIQFNPRMEPTLIYIYILYAYLNATISEL